MPSYQITFAEAMEKKLPFIVERITQDVEKQSSVLYLNNGTIHRKLQSIKPQVRAC